MSTTETPVLGRSFSDVPPPSGFCDTPSSGKNDTNEAPTETSTKRRSYRRSTNRMSIPPSVNLNETGAAGGEDENKPETTFMDRFLTQAPIVAEAVKANFERILRKELEPLEGKVNVDRIVTLLVQSDIADQALEGYCEDSNPEIAQEDFRYVWRSVSKLRKESLAWSDLVEKTNTGIKARASLGSVMGTDASDVHEPTMAALKRPLKEIKDLDDLINARRAALQARIKMASHAVETRTEYFERKADMMRAVMKD